MHDSAGSIYEMLAQKLIDQQAARTIVPPDSEGPGNWFGGGNLWPGSDGSLWLVGRYRNRGDSRTGIAAGTRGFALAVFRSRDGGKSFLEVWRRTKQEIAPPGEEVLSIEGAAIWEHDGIVELLVSSEKSSRRYPDVVASYQKPGTGVWTVDRVVAGTLEELQGADVAPLLASDTPEIVHVKDPFIYRGTDGNTLLGVCTHPFNWSSSNTLLLPYAPGATTQLLELNPQDCLPRGLAWDVAMTRLTSIVDLPVSGNQPHRQLVFYDGGECVRPLDPHQTAVRRPRGYSCEELGGLGLLDNAAPASFRRLSRWFPSFISPHGTGCSRYVDVLATDETWHATWQQAQPDGSQPLVHHSIPTAEVQAMLRKSTD